MVSPIERVLAALNDARAEYLVVGGVAVVLYGYLRTTADLDLVVRLDEGNVARALAALESIGYQPRAPVPARQFADREIRDRWRREKNLRVFALWSDAAPTLEVDLFVEEPFDFASVYSRATRVALETTFATVVPLDELIHMKERAGRPRDQEDVRALRAVTSHGSEGP